jgi:dynactin-5
MIPIELSRGTGACTFGLSPLFHDAFWDFGKGIYVHRDALIYGGVEPKGCGMVAAGAVVHGSAACSIGDMVVILEKAVVKSPLMLRGDDPPLKREVPFKIGSFVLIGRCVACEAAEIGNCVVVEDNAVLGSLCVIGHGSRILRDTVIPDASVVPPFSVVGGCPPRVVALLNEDAQPLIVRAMISDFVLK